MKAPAFLFFVRDWLCSKTIRKLHSVPGSRGVAAYLFLLCESWLEDPPATLPDDHDELAFMARVSREEWDRLWPILSCQFQSDGNGRIFNVRLMEEWQRNEKRKKQDRDYYSSKQRARKEQVSIDDSGRNRTRKRQVSVPRKHAVSTPQR